MKFFISFILLCIAPFLKIMGQSISISPDGSPPESSAILDIQSTTKGLLIPRMTLEERDAILLPGLGLTIFQIDDVEGFYFYDGSSWSPVSRPSLDEKWITSVDDIYNNNEGNIGIGTSTPAGKINIKGSADTTQLVIDAHFIQSNSHPLIKLRKSDGADLMWINSDHPTNTFIGVGSGKQNIISAAATNNTFIGSHSGYSNTMGFGNTALGTTALYGNTSGYNNTATGLWALYSNTTACQNTAVGTDALFTQSFSNNNNTWNSDNVAVGFAALTANAPTTTTNGIANTAVGSFALTANTIGYDNTGIGTSALYSNTIGHENTALGRQSLFYNTIGEGNSANGYKSLRTNSTGSGNTAHGSYALFNSTIGSFNTAVGNHALDNNTSGEQNSCLGSYSNTSLSNLGNATAIGTFAIVNTADKVRLGSSNVTVVEGQVAYSWPSDGRFKENIRHDVKGLDFILKLEPVSYNFNRLMYARHIHETITKDREEKLIDQSKNRSVGFIAQDVEKIIQQTGFTSFDALHAPVNETDNYSMGYAEFVVPLVKAVQELNEKLISENEMLIKRIEKLELLIAEKVKN